MIIAVDLDNVLAESDHKIREIILKISGVSLAQDDISVFSYGDTLASKGIELDSARQIENQALRIFNEVECEHIGLVIGAQHGVSQLVDAGHQIHIVTSRPGIAENPTKEWLRKYGIRFSELLFTEDKSGFGRDWSFLVEDAPHHAENAAKAGTRVCLVDYPWNRSISKHSLIHRVRNWVEVVDRVLNS